ncbi:M23 family metallopeptidase [Luteimonas sp. e5]
MSMPSRTPSRHPRALRRDMAVPVRFMLILGLLSAAPAVAAQWLSWPPQPDAVTPPRHEARAPVRLRVESRDAVREVWVDNDLAGPVEVRIESAAGLPGLPLQALLRTRGAHRLARIEHAPALQLTLTAVPGVPAVSAQDVAYRFPLALAQARVGQGPHGRFSHADAENRHAIDFTAAPGTPVLAARAGVVMQVEDRHPDRPGHIDEANFVRLLHGDGSMALYAHLQRGSAGVRPGQQVAVGQVIARSGNSGYSSGPHLHFAVQVNAGLRLRSVPVRIVGERGELRLPAGSD